MCPPPPVSRAAFATPLFLGGRRSPRLDTSSSSRPSSLAMTLSSPPSGMSRRAVLSLALASVSGILAMPQKSLADLSTQLVMYRDLPKGFTILRPSGWNEFESLVDNYDMKWQDVIQPLEFVTVLTNPLPKGKTLADIGGVQALGNKLAASRGGKLVSAVEKDIDGVPAYVFDIERDQARQITLLSVNKMKLYSVNASCPVRRWSKRERLLRACIESFKPRL